MKRSLIFFAAAVWSFAPTASAQDPFGNPAKSNKPANQPQSQSFDPFSSDGPSIPVTTEEPPSESRDDLSIRYEAFSLDLGAAASLMRSGSTDAALYQTLVEMVERETAVQENLTVIRTKSGQKSSNDAAFEYIYPTEWEPAELPNSIGVKIDPPTGANGTPAAGDPDRGALQEARKLKELPLFATPATATAFETRQLGFALEVETNPGANGVIDAVIAPEHVTLSNVGKWGQGVSTLEMPEIESQRISTQILLVPGLPRLLGTMNRPPVSKADPHAAERIWFAFITASHVK